MFAVSTKHLPWECPWIDDNQLRAIIEVETCKTIWEVTEEI